MNQYIDIEFDKPLYQYNGKYCIRLRDKYLRQARKTGKLLRITTPHGTGIYSYQEWMKGSKKHEQVYKFPDKPMKLIENYFEAGHGEATMENYLDNMSRLAKVFRKKYE